MSETDADEQGFDALLEEGERCLKNVEHCLEGVDDLDTLEDDTVEELLGDVETLVRVVRETEELLETIDFGNLPEAVEADELLEAIDAGEIPEALLEDDTGATDVVDFTQLFTAIDLLNAWNAADLGALWQEKRELEGAVDELGDEDGDAGLVEETVASVTDDDDGLVGDGELLEGDLRDELDDLDADPSEILGDIDVAEDPEAYQVAIQQQAMKGIDAFRSALLETHEKFERLYEMNREKMRRQDTSTNSRNPTAAATIPTERRDLGGSARYSTVPKQVKLSTAPTRKRIYGRRFEIERERNRRNNDD
ncbi:hypothetical protein [Natronolimnohabitans innermongolicus]|uniref:Uncharacterized protein n=1 Tax=Natronolimnohabitans innermongolicus JCM 12255 TaxID=1227499 RepID=L9WQI2_9EURY|nr:hypothetical protein [Natronolimnohabitans innermongolicus]ELY51744.1 hypothetical protein C493_17481 [Natronolimnohabitans innermongolicus JCM 12255]